METWQSPRDKPGAGVKSAGLGPGWTRAAPSSSRGEKLMYYVYILLLSNNQLYTGFTGDLKERIPKHKSGGVESTRNYRPLQLVHYEAYLLEADARRREKFLKTSDGKLFLRRQLSVFFQKIGRYTDYTDAIL